MPRPRPESTSLSPFAANVIRLRTEKHWSLAKVAALVGTKPANISRIEMGTYYPNAAIIPKFMEAFEVSADELFRPDTEDEREIRELIRRLRKLSPAQRGTINNCMIAFANKQKVNLLVGPIPGMD